MDRVIEWLLEGDVSIQYITRRDLLCEDAAALSELRMRIADEGYSAEFLSRQNENGHWGIHYYQKKWTCTHYTLLDLKNLCAPAALVPCRYMVRRMFDECLTGYGGMKLTKYSDTDDACIDGMVLNYTSYFLPEEPRLVRLADYLLSVQKPDGGFSWDISSGQGDPHTTICVLEGLGQYRTSGSSHGSDEIGKCEAGAVEFLLSHGLFFDDGDNRFRKLSYPYRYRYDLLRVLEYFTVQRVRYDPRMLPALEWLKDKRRDDGLWYLENQHKGNVHFQMEETGSPSRFVTLKALTILRYFADFKND